MIEKFRGKYSWLSNFHPCTVEYGDLIFGSVELFYIAMKTKDNLLRYNISLMDSSEAGKLKKESKSWAVRSDWDDIKLGVMEYGLREKFKDSALRQKLLETENQNIQEGNYWNDRFWGVDLKIDPNIGENHLGRLLMKIRDELR